MYPVDLEEIGREGDFSSLTCIDYFNLFEGIKTIQTFDDKGKNKVLTNIYHFNGNIPEKMYRRLKYMNNDGAGIFMCVNETDGKGRRLSNIVKVRAVFVDLDGSPVDPVLEYKPSIVVESSPGRFHCYWLTNDTPLNGFSELQKNIAKHLNGDVAVHDLPRVLRVPGFYHNKYKRFLSKICGGSGIKFTYRELVDWFPPEKVPQWSSKRYKLEAKKSFSGEFKGKYGVSSGERNDHVIKIIGGMIKRGCSWSYIEEEAYKDGRASIPPLDDKEIASILKSAQKYVGKV